MIKHAWLPAVLIAILFSFIAAPRAQAQSKLEVGGYMQTWYIPNQSGDVAPNSDADFTTSGFRLRRARLVARGRLNDTFSATSWLEFAGANNILLDFHIDAHLKPWLNLRAGQFIMPGQSYDTGRLVSSQLRFWERPQATTQLSSTMGYDGFRDIGVMAYGSYGRLWYGIHAGNGAGRFSQAGSQIRERDFGSGLYGARVDYEAIDGLTIGGHLSTNQQNNLVEEAGQQPFDIDRTSWSLRLNTNNLGVERLYTQFEYLSMYVNDDNRGVTAIDGEYDMHGWYAEAGYGITPAWQVLARYERGYQRIVGEKLSAIPGVCDVYFTMGDTDFIVVAHLPNREFVESLIMAYESIDE
ncbi:MAG: hypothetical protein ACOC2C_03295, partial [Cyclonatronaceae bacterium]